MLKQKKLQWKNQNSSSPEIFIRNDDLNRDSNDLLFGLEIWQLAAIGVAALLIICVLIAIVVVLIKRNGKTYDYDEYRYVFFSKK